MTVSHHFSEFGRIVRRIFPLQCAFDGYIPFFNKESIGCEIPFDEYTEDGVGTESGALLRWYTQCVIKLMQFYSMELAV